MWLAAGALAAASAVAPVRANPVAPTPVLAPLALPGAVPPLAPWKAANLPGQSLPATRFSAVTASPVLPDSANPGGEPDGALQVDAQGSYGSLLQAFDDPAGRRAVARSTRAWSWRVERANPGIDLATKGGDDTDLKVCVLFDLPTERVPLAERWLLRLARSRTGEALPAATVCYTADLRQPAGSRVDNAYSRRVRYLVLRGAGDDLSRWKAESRRLADDFRLLFGDESNEVPPVLGIAVGADADNTGGTSRAFIARLRLEPPGGGNRP